MKIEKLCKMIDEEKYSVIDQIDIVYEIVRSSISELYVPIVSEPEIQRLDDGRTLIVYEHSVEGKPLSIAFAWDSNNIIVNYILGGETNTVVARMVVIINGHNPVQTNLEQLVKVDSIVRADILETNKTIAQAIDNYMNRKHR